MANPYAEISKSRSKKNPFKVRYIGENGKVVASSETLTTVWNCKKNIKAMIGLVLNEVQISVSQKGNYMLVFDLTGKKKRTFHMAPSGHESFVEFS